MSKIQLFNTPPLQNTGNQRIIWVDAAKGFAMLIIMWGHMQTSSPLKTFLTSFHVPIFLVLTGFLLTGANKADNGKILIKKLLRPYVVFSIMAIVCNMAYHLAFSGKASMVDGALTDVWKTVSCFGIKAIWFIPSYFIACLLFHATKKNPLWVQLLLLLLWAGIGMLGSLFFYYLKNAVSSDLVYDLIYYPTAAMLRGLACTFFVVLGKLLYELFLKLQTVSCSDIILGAIGLTCLILNYYLSGYLRGNFSMLELGYNSYLHFINGALGSIWVMVMFYLLKSLYTFPLLRYIGRKSLIIMGTHMSLLLNIFVPMLVWQIIPMPEAKTVNYYLFGLVCVIVMMIIEVPIIKLLDGKLKFLIKGRVIKNKS